MTRPKIAVVVGATNGIGKAIACRLAQEGFQIIAVGRAKEGRESEVLGYLEKCSSASSSSGTNSHASGSGPMVKHEFRSCNAFELAQVKQCAEGIVNDYTTAGIGGDGASAEGTIDALVMTQGMATIQKFTPTAEGNDEKLTLHFWSRAAFANCLLPALRTTPAPSSSSDIMPGGPVVLSVLSGGVHSPYGKYENDPELKNNYSVANAADCAGYYTDLFFDKLARRESNINFVHAAPGFVATNWGTEMPVWLRTPIRGMQKLMGKSPEKCASFMVQPIVECSSGKISLENEVKNGLYIMKEDGSSGKLTKGHTKEAMDSVWESTKDVLGRAGIHLGD